MKKILHNKPCLGDQEVKAVKRVLESDWLIAGVEVRKLESSIKKLVGAKYATATNSGSSALHLSLIAFGIGRKDEVIIPTYTCTALLNAIYYVDAVPVIVDIEKKGFNIDPVKTKNRINKKTKAIIVPHTFGFPAKIDEVKKFNIPIVEDCAHAIGSNFKGKPLGSFGDISTFSFYATKVIACGQGGMITTNNRKYFEIAKDLAYYDRRKDYKIRYNYQLTDIAAAIGNVQFEKFPLFIKRRRAIASRYINVLEKNRGLQYWPKREDGNLNYYRFIIKFANQKIRDEFKIQLAKNGVSTVVPIDSYQLLHRYLKLDKREFLNAEELSKTTLALPIHPSLTDKEINKVMAALDLVLKK